MNYERLFQYDDWADREEIAHLRRIENRRALRLLAHVVGTSWVWLSRVQRAAAKMAVWREVTIEQIAAELPLLRDAWTAFLSTHPSGFIEYVNSKGESWTSEIADVLTHVPMHGAYHRGQIATVV